MPMSPETPELILYGGTFDPPHRGHIESVAATLESFPEAQLQVLPAAAPAGAGGRHKQPVASFDDRMALCRAAFADFAPRVWISPLEWALPKPNFTLNTLRAIAAEARGARLALLLGEDQLAAFADWHAPREILALADLVVVPREPSAVESVIRSLGARLGCPVHWNAATRQATLAGVSGIIRVLAQPVATVSSHEIRAAMAVEAPPPCDWLPASVQTVITERRLYAARS